MHSVLCCLWGTACVLQLLLLPVRKRSLFLDCERGGESEGSCQNYSELSSRAIGTKLEHSLYLASSAQQHVFTQQNLFLVCLVTATLLPHLLLLSKARLGFMEEKDLSWNYLRILNAWRFCCAPWCSFTCRPQWLFSVSLLRLTLQPQLAV